MEVIQVPEFKVNQVLFDDATKYEHYQVVDTEYDNRPARILYTDNRTAAQSGFPFDGKPELLFDYNERFMELVKGFKPKQVLVIGGGAFTLPMAIMRQFPDMKMDIFELDGGLLDIANKYFGFRENSNVKVYIGDGRALLRQTNKKYDLIILDVFNSIDIPKDFQEPELINELKDSLNPNGLVAMNVIAAYHGERAKILRSLSGLFENGLKKITVYPAGHSLSFWISQNFILVAGKKASKAANYLRYKPIDEEVW